MNPSRSRGIDAVIRAMGYAVVAIEVLVALALTALAVMAVLVLGMELWGIATVRTPLNHAEFVAAMGSVLQVFILVELFRIAIAYMRHENVVPTVLEATLIAVARKLIVFDSTGDNYLGSAAGLALLVVAVAVAWWLLAKANACEMQLDD